MEISDFRKEFEAYIRRDIELSYEFQKRYESFVPDCYAPMEHKEGETTFFNSWFGKRK